VDRASRSVPVKLREVECFRYHALTRKCSIAMNQNRDYSLTAGVAQVLLFGPHYSFYDRVNPL
jgi:hypothetical protein